MTQSPTPPESIFLATTQRCPSCQSSNLPYYQGSGVFVRADVTYLKQDFSVVLPVADHGPWPATQRFDFLVRERAATPSDNLAAAGRHGEAATEQQRSAFFALRALTGLDPGPAVSDWKRALLGAPLVASVRDRGFGFATAVAADAGGRTYVADGGTIFVQDPGGASKAWLSGEATASLLIDPKGRLLAARGSPAAVNVVDTRTKEMEPAAASFAGNALVGPSGLAADGVGGVYFNDEGDVLYLSAQGGVSRALIGSKGVRAAGVSPDGRTLFVAAGDALHAHALESAGSVDGGRRVATLGGAEGQPGAASALAVDRRGTVFVANAAAKRVEAFHAGGLRLAVLDLDETPTALAVGGAGGRTLFILTRTKLLTTELAAAR